MSEYEEEKEEEEEEEEEIMADLKAYGTPPGLCASKQKHNMVSVRGLSPIGDHGMKTRESAEMIAGISKCIGALSFMEDDENHVQKLMNMEDKWVWECIEAVVDSGSVDTVINPKRLPGHRIIETNDSKEGAHWTCAGATKIQKLGMIKMPWITDSNKKMRTEVMVGAVGKTLVSTHRLDEEGWDTILTKMNPRICNRDTGEVIALEKKGKMHVLKMWVRINKGIEGASESTSVNVLEIGRAKNDHKVRVFRRQAAVHP